MIVLAMILVVATPVEALIDDPDLDTSGSYLYAIDTDVGTVEVRIEVVMTADKPNRNLADGSYYEYYFDGYVIPIPVEAENLRVTNSGGTELAYERSELEGGADVLDISFNRNVFYRQSTTVIVEFSLASGPSGSNEPTRINPATVSFLAWTSPTLEQATVTVSAPPGFVDNSDGFFPFEQVTEGSDTDFVATDVDPETYFTVVSLTNDDALVVEPVDVTINGEMHVVQVESWPGDDRWRNRVTEGVMVGLPRLVDLIGQPWPIEDDLVVTESFSPYLDGYAAWYDPSLKEIEMGDDPDLLVLYHELSHVWLNRELFADRWITEGMADYFGASAVEAGGDSRPEPERVTPTSTGAIALADFTPFVTDLDEEEWAYKASWTVMEAIAEEVGPETMIEIIDAAANKEYSYLGDGEPETTKIVAGTRHFLDLIENAQEVEHGPVADLFETWVAGRGDPSTSLDEAALAERSEARSRYFDLVDRGDRWAAPHGVRTAMMLWRFDEADTLIDEAEAAIEQRNELQDLVGPTGARLPRKLEQLYEAADEDYDQFTLAREQVSRVGNRIREASDQAEASRSLIQRIGLIGTDVEAETNQAIVAFQEGQLGPAIIEAAEVETILDGSQRAGLLRLILTLTLAPLLLVAGWVFGLRPLLRRRRSSRA